MIVECRIFLQARGGPWDGEICGVDQVEVVSSHRLRGSKHIPLHGDFVGQRCFETPTLIAITARGLPDAGQILCRIYTPSGAPGTTNEWIAMAWLKVYNLFKQA